jgi:hypothetical protein
MSSEETQGEEDDHAVEKACMERVQYWLKKYNCMLIPIIELRPGQVKARIDIEKISPEVLKQLKQAEKYGNRPPEASA